MLPQHLRPLVLVSVIAFLLSPAIGAQEAVRAAESRALSVRSNLAEPATERRVEDLLKQMTLEEKVGQLVQYSVGTPTGPGTGRGGYEEMIAGGQVGSLFNLENAAAANRYQHMAMEKSRLHIPLLFGLDVIHGYRTIFPVPLAMASTWDPPVVERAAHLAAE